MVMKAYLHKILAFSNCNMLITKYFRTEYHSIPILSYSKLCEICKMVEI